MNQGLFLGPVKLWWFKHKRRRNFLEKSGGTTKNWHFKYLALHNIWHVILSKLLERLVAIINGNLNFENTNSSQAIRAFLGWTEQTNQSKQKFKQTCTFPKLTQSSDQIPCQTAVLQNTFKKKSTWTNTLQNHIFSKIMSKPLFPK